MAYANSILVAATQHDLEQGQQEAMGDGAVMLLLSFGVLSQPIKWEHHVTFPGQCNPIRDENLMEETQVLYLNDAARRCCAKQCATQAKEAGELWEGSGVTRGVGEVRHLD